MNGLFSLVNFGLANADGGFAPSLGKLPPVGDYSTSMGYLTFPFQTNNGTDVTSKIDELSTMITAGRLSSENKQVLLVSLWKVFMDSILDDDTYCLCLFIFSVIGIGCSCPLSQTLWH